MLNCSWDTVCDQCNCEFSFLGYFLPFYSHNSLKNENFNKMKKTPGHIIILHRCTKNHDHVILFLRYDTWHIELLFFILGQFLPFDPPSSPKTQNLKKNKKQKNNNNNNKKSRKKLLEISLLYTCVP